VSAQDMQIQNGKLNSTALPLEATRPVSRSRL